MGGHDDEPRLVNLEKVYQLAFDGCFNVAVSYGPVMSLFRFRDSFQSCASRLHVAVTLPASVVIHLVKNHCRINSMMEVQNDHRYS